MSVEPGDVVLLRTGAMSLFLAGDREGYASTNAGPSTQSVDWFHDHDVAAVATDNPTFECVEFERAVPLPVHALHLVEMGMTQGQNWNLEELAADCAADGRVHVPALGDAGTGHRRHRRPGRPGRGEVATAP